MKKKEKPVTGRKRGKKKFIFLGIAVILVGLAVFYKVSASNVKMPVAVRSVTRGDVESTLSISGVVKSTEELVYYAPISTKIDEVSVKVGDSVSTGEMLYAFSSEDLDFQQSQTSLKDKAGRSEYQDGMQKNAESAGKLGEAEVNLAILNQQIADTEKFIQDKTLELDAIKRHKEEAFAKRQRDISKIKPDPNNDNSDAIRSMSADLTYDSVTWMNDEEIQTMELAISLAKDNLADYQEEKAKMDAQKSQNENSLLSSSSKSALLANRTLAKEAADHTLSNIEEARTGGVASFNGVITSVTAIPGATVPEGTELLRMVNQDKIEVQLALSKYDLEKVREGQKADITIAGRSYQGEVSKISNIAEMNANNTPIVKAYITITNPDENIILGLEAKITIHAEKVEGALLIPVEIINSDKDGDFVYVVENGIVTRRNVVLGISSDAFSEVKEGLNEGDQLLTDSNMNITEGMEVTPMPEEETTESSPEK